MAVCKVKLYKLVERGQEDERDQENDQEEKYKEKNNLIGDKEKDFRRRVQTLVKAQIMIS